MCNFISKNQKLFDELDRVIDVLPEIDESALIFTLKAVSYTHLDVYKRQVYIL